MSQSIYCIEMKGAGDYWVVQLTYFCLKDAQMAMSVLKDKMNYRIKETKIPEENKR